MEKALVLARDPHAPLVRSDDRAGIVDVTDVAIVGGGLAGSLTAAMLGRAGINAVLIDPRAEYPPDFRCEKLDGDQVALLHKTGLAEAVLRATTPDHESWFARFGFLVEQRPGDQEGIFYAQLVNTVRAQIPSRVRFVNAKATAIATGPERQTITTSMHEKISARLIVLANGLNIGLRDQLGLSREILSACHSIAIGFDLTPVGRSEFSFKALTYYAERPSERAAYITLFPIGRTMRANLFVYRTMGDPWLQALRASPQKTLFELMPRLRRFLGDFIVTDQIKIRPIDLCATGGHLQPGLVLVGDAFSTSCPAAGTGARKVLTDVERLCNVHIPQWLATPGMGLHKIAVFYDDPVKVACDRFAINKAYTLKALSTDTGWLSRLRRLARFIGQLGRGRLRRVKSRFISAAKTHQAGPTGRNESPQRMNKPRPA